MKFSVAGERSNFSAFPVVKLFAEHKRRKAEITNFNKSGLISSEVKRASNLSAF